MEIPCYIGRFRPQQEVPKEPWSLGGLSVADYFSHASAGDISLKLNLDRLDWDLVEGNTTRSGTSSKEIWMGAALGFAFGAVGGVVSAWTPVVGGMSTGAKIANALIEITSTGLTSGLAAGTSNALNGRSFEDGFKSGLIMGA